MKTVDVVLAWLLIAFGALHTSMTPKAHPSLDINAVWFASGGLMIIAVGALNLLRVAYSSVAKGVWAVSVGANLVVLALMLYIATLFPLRSNPQVLIGLTLVAVLTVFSVLRRGGQDHPKEIR